VKIFLALEQPQNVLVFQRAQLPVPHLFIAASLQEFRRPQETAYVIRAIFGRHKNLSCTACLTLCENCSPHIIRLSFLSTLGKLARPDVMTACKFRIALYSSAMLVSKIRRAVS
jgi:hypothetical protein